MANQLKMAQVHSILTLYATRLVSGRVRFLLGLRDCVRYGMIRLAMSPTERMPG